MPGSQRNPGGDRWLRERSGRARIFLATGLLSVTAVVATALVAVATEGEPAVIGAAAGGGHSSRDSSPTSQPAADPTAAASTPGPDATATTGAGSLAATSTASASAVATASPAATVTAGTSPTAAAAGPVDRFALLEALPLPDDAWFEENPAGVDQAYTTAATGQVVIDLHDVYLRADGWSRSGADDGGARWVKGENQVILELAPAGDGQLRVHIRIIP